MLRDDMEDDAERHGFNDEIGYGSGPTSHEWDTHIITNNQRRFAKAQHLALGAL